MLDMVIAGGGPAGLTAAIYAARAGLNAIVIEKFFTGGQAAKTNFIENYPGFPDGITGFDFADALTKQAQNLGIKIVYEDILSFDIAGEIKTVKTNNAEYQARTVVLCMGATPRKLEIEGEESLEGKGVSYCATCDGAFFKNRDVIVIGGGDTAGEDALYLAAICNTVYLAHRRDEFRMQKHLSNKIAEKQNIHPLMSTIPIRFEGESVLTGMRVKDLKSGEEKTVEVAGAFVAVGVKPNSELIEGMVELNQGYVVTDQMMCTNLKGVFAAGDIVKKPLRQIVTAVSDGAIAVYSALNYLAEG